MNRRPYHLLFGGLAILITAQVLNFAQVQASTEKALTQAQVSHKLVAARDLKVSLERGMGLGKPLSLFSGTDKLFGSLKNRYDGIEFLATTGPSMEPYAQEGPSVLSSLSVTEVPAFGRSHDAPPGGQYQTLIHGDLVLVALPLYFNESDLKGMVWLGFSRAPIMAQLQGENQYGLTVLAVALIFSILAFVALFFSFVRQAPPLAPGEPRPTRGFYLPLLTRLSLTIVGVLLVAILGYSFATSGRFTSILVKIYEKNAVVLVRSQAEELKRILDWDIAPEHWKGLEGILAAQIRHTPEAESLTLTNPQGKVLFRADRHGVWPDATKRGVAAPEFLPSVEGLREPLVDRNGQLRAQLWTKVDQSFLDSILLDRFLDALTVTLVSLIFSIELLLAIGLVVRKETPSPREIDSEKGIKVVRFTAFLFFMSELLPLPFLPLFISDLYAHAPLAFLGLSSDAVKGLPFSAHLFGVMLFVPVVGALAQRFSLRQLFLLSGGLLLVGNVLASTATSLPVLILYRFISGLGYGGALAASAGLVVQTTGKDKRTSGFAAWGAGFAAASICAVILGGILVSHVGYRNGLLVSALLSVILAVFVVFQHPRRPPELGTVQHLRTRFSDLLAPFRDRSALITLLFASLPVQLAFFGLFQYTLPLVMSQAGVSEANIGRILTIYGLISLASPLVARYSDRTRREKQLLVWGNVITGLGLSVFFFQAGMPAVILVVAAIGVGGLLFDTVISSHLSMTSASEKFGETKFLSIFLTWEKLFTVFVPVLVGTLMSSLGYSQSVAVLGAATLVGAALFALLARPRKSRP